MLLAEVRSGAFARGKACGQASIQRLVQQGSLCRTRRTLFSSFCFGGDGGRCPWTLFERGPSIAAERLLEDVCQSLFPEWPTTLVERPFRAVPRGLGVLPHSENRELPGPQLQVTHGPQRRLWHTIAMDGWPHIGRLQHDNTSMAPANTKKQELFGSGNATDPVFIHLRDPHHEWECTARDFAERLWIVYRDYADHHFLTEIRRDFSARFWEMYLTCALLEKAPEHGYSLTCPKPGPDICLDLRGDRIWIEAVVATNGAPGQPDTLIEPSSGGRLPEDKIVLRYTTAIRDKYVKYLRYLRMGLVHREDAYVIAVNRSGLAYRWVQAAIDLPRFLKAVYPIGELEVLIDRNELRISGMQNRSRFFISKANKSDVPVQAFVDRRWRGLSAILCSDVDVGSSKLPLGYDLEIAYNPLSRCPLARGIIPSAREWWAKLDGSEGELFCDPDRFE